MLSEAADSFLTASPLHRLTGSRIQAAVGVGLTGAIIVNRYDVAVALVVAALLVCLVQRWYVGAALVLISWWFSYYRRKRRRQVGRRRDGPA